MMFLADSSEDPKVIEKEIGAEVGQLLTPLTRFSDRGLKYAIDNGAFSDFNANGFLSLIERQADSLDRCLFVAVPDVVGSARRTSELFSYWTDKIRSKVRGFPIAYVIQDGIENVDIPWDYIAAIFVGGTTWFKESVHAKHAIRAAQILNKWVHVGRINTPNRWSYFESLGADSCDGSGLSRYSFMRKEIMSPSLYSLQSEDNGIAK